MDELRAFFLGSEARRYRRAFSRVGWALALMLVLELAGQVLLQLLCAWLAPALLERLEVLYGISALASYGLAAPAALLVLGTLPAPAEELPVRPLSPLRALQLWLVCVGGSYLLNFLTLWLMDELGRALGAPVSDPVGQVALLSPWVSIPLTCLVGPAVEELCFRGRLLSRLRAYGDGFALCTSSLLFALFHANLFQSLYTFAIGFLLGAVTLATGQLRWAVGFHAAFNLLSVGVSPLASALGTPGEAAFSLLVIFSMAWTLHWLVDQGEALSRTAKAMAWGNGEIWGHFLVNPGMTVFLLAILWITWRNLF